MEKTNNIASAPEPMHSFLIYIESIQGKSQRTAEEYFYDLRTFYRFLNLHFGIVEPDADFDTILIDNVNLEMLKKVDLNILYEYASFLNSVRHNKSRARSRKISALRSYFKYLHSKLHLIDENPTVDLDSVKIEKQLPRHFTLEDSLRLLDSVDGRNAERDLCILTLFLNCGMRLSELVGINLTDINGDELVVIGKGNKERVVYLNDSCISVIENYLPERNKVETSSSDANRALFLSERGNRISRRTVQSLVEKYVKKLGLDPHKYTTHKLRHTAATLMHQSGVDIRVLQEILGHKQLSTTEIYTHINNDEIRAAVSKNPLNTESVKNKI